MKSTLVNQGDNTNDYRTNGSLGIRNADKKHFKLKEKQASSTLPSHQKFKQNIISLYNNYIHNRLSITSLYRSSSSLRT